MYVTCSFILMKIKSFSCDMFCTSTRSEKEAKSNLEVKVKSGAQPGFCSMDRQGVFLECRQINELAGTNHSYRRHTQQQTTVNIPIQHLCLLMK